jgi:hypothetical protein
MKKYVELARRVWDHYQFLYGPRGLEIAKCARYMKEKCDERNVDDEWKRNHLRYVAKNFYITQICAIYRKSRPQGV